jgi:hypothetical protein
MGDTKLDSFPIGAGKFIPVDHTGPASYTAGGETLGQINNQTGITAQGLSTIDAVEGSGSLSVSGNYSVRIQPTGSGSRKTFKALWFNAGNGAPQAGVPLSLGTLSAAATQSTYTAAGLVTVVGANTLKVGQFIALSNGAANAGIIFDGCIVQVASATSSQYTFYFGQAVALAYTIAADTLKYQVVQVNSSNLLQSQALAAPITGVLATANLLTITQANSLSVGQFVYLSGTFKSASVYALGALVQVASATSTGWTANWQGTIIAQTSSEVAVASLLVTNGNAPVTTGLTSVITNSVGTATAATVAGLLAMTALNNWVVGNILVIQGLATNAKLDGSIGPVISTTLAATTFDINTYSAAASTHSEASGTAALLVTGATTGAGDVAAGTNLSGETVRLAYVGR